MTAAVWAALLAARDAPAPPPARARAGPPPSARPGRSTRRCSAARRDAPFCFAQVGQSLDGRVATVSGDARDVSGPQGLAHLHRCRALADAVVVGVRTALTDDPRLTVRLVRRRRARPA